MEVPGCEEHVSPNSKPTSVDFGVDIAGGWDLGFKGPNPALPESPRTGTEVFLCSDTDVALLSVVIF